MLSKTLTLATLTSLASAQVTSDSSLPFPIPTSYISSLSNHVGGTQTQTQPETAATRSDCTTVTMQGEPMFTIQTDTMTPTGCTYTVFASGSSMANNTSMVVPTFSSLPVPVAPGPVVTAANGTNATMTMAGTGGMMTSTSSGMAGGAGGSMSTSGSGSGMGSSTTGGGSNGGSGGSGSGTSSASGSSASSTDSAANAHAILAGEAVGLAAVGAAFMLL